MTTSVITTRHGRFRVIDEDPWVSRSLRELGEFSEDEYRFLRLVVQTLATKAGPIEMIEAGPYIGDLTVPLSRVVGKIYAFEPQKQVRELLLENLEMNGVKNVEVFPYAVGDTPGKATYLSEGMGSCHCFAGNQLCNPDGDAVAEMVTLDSLGLNPSLIKADIEGMEPHLIAGGYQTLQRTRCPLFMEFDTVFQQGEMQLPEILTSCGYTVFPQFYPIYREDNFNKNPINNFGVTVSKMIYAVPPIE